MIVYKRFHLFTYLVLVLLLCGALMSAVYFNRYSADEVVAAETLILQPGSEGKDAFVSDYYGGSDSSGSNYGSNATLMLGKGMIAYFHSYLEFDLSAIPAGSTINSATLELYFESVGGGTVVTKHRVTSIWSENTITWNNQPSYAASSGSQVISAGAWNSFDVTSIISQSLSANYGMSLRYLSSSPNVPSFITSSDGAANHPKLTVNYTAPVSPPADPDLPPASHRACVSGKCQSVSGSGSDECSNDSQCAALPSGSTTGTTGSSSSSSGDCTGDDCATANVTSQSVDCPDGEECNEINADSINQENGSSTTSGSKNKSSTTGQNGGGALSVFVSASESPLPLAVVALATLLSIGSVLTTFWSVLSAEMSAKQYVLALWNYLASFFKVKDKSKMGQVYDATSGKPIAGAVVNLFSYPEMKLLSSAVSDTKGNFYFVAREGKYALSATCRGFVFPSEYAKRDIGHDTSIYIGQPLQLDESGVINFRIAMDPSARALGHKPGVIRALFLSNTFRLILMFAGTAFSVAALYYIPSTTNYILLGSYLIIWLLELVIENRLVKFSKVIEKYHGEPVDLALVRISGEDGKLKQTLVTDYKGRVLIKTDSSSDEISIERAGYKKTSHKFEKPGFIEGKHFELEKL